jgi:hypothetical protein
VGALSRQLRSGATIPGDNAGNPSMRSPYWPKRSFQGRQTRIILSPTAGQCRLDELPVRLARLSSGDRGTAPDASLGEPGGGSALVPLWNGYSTGDQFARPCAPHHPGVGIEQGPGTWAIQTSGERTLERHPFGRPGDHMAVKDHCGIPSARGHVCIGESVMSQPG